MGEIKVIKRYGYRQARVKSGLIFPRESLAEFEKSLIKQSHGIPDNHVVYLIESKVNGHSSQRIALYFHDFGVIIGTEKDIVLK